MPTATGAPGDRRESAWIGRALVLPAVVVDAIFFVLPVGALVVSSFVSSAGLDASVYVHLAVTPLYASVLMHTLEIASATTVASILIAYPCALYLYLGGHLRTILVYAVLGPLFVSGVVRIYGWVLVFVPQTGVLAYVPGLQGLNLYQSDAAVVVGLVHTILPFAVLSVYAGFLELNPRLLWAANSLGADSWQLMGRVIVPLTRSGVLAATALSASLAITIVGVPVLLGGPRSATLAYLVYQQFLIVYDYPMGAGLAVLLLVTALSIFLASSRLFHGRAVVEAVHI